MTRWTVMLSSASRSFGIMATGAYWPVLPGSSNPHVEREPGPPARPPARTIVTSGLTRDSEGDQLLHRRRIGGQGHFEQVVTGGQAGQRDVGLEVGRPAPRRGAHRNVAHLAAAAVEQPRRRC